MVELWDRISLCCAEVFSRNRAFQEINADELEVTVVAAVFCSCVVM